MSDMSRLWSVVCAALATTFSTLCSQTEHAERRDTVYTISPIIVTATQAKERQTPATFSNLSSTEIHDRYSVQDIPLLLSELPSITTYSENGNGVGYNYISLRGFDQRRISVMINGVPQNDPEDHNVYWIDFPDLLASTDNIQVQRGAGSAFYGPPAIGGSVNLVTTPFRREPRMTLESIFGFQEFGDSSKSTALNTRKYSATFNSGLVNEQYMVYGKLGKILSDGYRENSYVDMNSYFLGALRLDKNAATRFHFFGGPIEDGLAYYGLPKSAKNDKKLRRQNLYILEDPSGEPFVFLGSRRKEEVENFSQPHYEMMNEWHVSPAVTLHNTLFYYTGDGSFDYDASWADSSILRIGYRYGVPTTQNPGNTLVRAFVGNRHWGWLPRVEIDHRDGNVTLGAELRFHRSTHWGKIQFAEGLPSNFDPDYHFYEYNGERDVISVYVHELYRWTEEMTVTADFQFVHNRYGITNEKFLGNSFNLPYFFVNPRLGLNYNATDKWNGYISLAYTSREPRMRNLYAAEDSYFGATPQFKADTTGGLVKYDFSQPLAKPERLFDVEIGARFKDDHGQISANLFWMEFTDELVKSGQVDIFGQPVTGNAQRTRHAGIELDGVVELGGALALSGNVSLSRNRLVRYTVIDHGAPVRLNGNPIAGFPDVLGNLRLTYHSELLTAAAVVKHVGSFYTDNFKNTRNKNDPYTVVNIELLQRLPGAFGVGLALRGEVRNVFNALYFTSGEGNAFFPAAERNYIVGLTVDL